MNLERLSVATEDVAAKVTSIGISRQVRTYAPLIGILGVATWFAFYLLTAPESGSEGADIYRFPWLVENQPLSDLHDSRCMLFLTTSRLLFRGARLIDGDVSAVTVMKIGSMVSAALALLLLYRFLTIDLVVSRVSAVVGTSFLGATYGFWRYASQAEVYTGATLLILGVIALLSAADRSRGRTQERWWTVAGATLAGLAVLFYKPTFIPLFLAVPFAFVWRRRWTGLISYIVVGGLVVLGGYVAAQLISQPEPLSVASLVEYMRARDDELHPSGLSLESALKASLTLGHNLLSTKWVFGFTPLVEVVRAIAPHKDYAEEIYGSSKAGVLVFFPLLTVPLFVAAFVWSIAGAARATRLDRSTIAPSTAAWTAACVAWLALCFLVNLILAPDEIEPWIIALPPLTALLVVWVIEPCVRARMVGPVALLVGTLAVHNLLGGIGIGGSRETDFFAQKTKWVVEHATPADLVLVTADRDNLAPYLRYVSRAQVTNLASDYTQMAVAEQIRRIGKQGGRVLVFDEIFSPPGWLERESPQSFALAETLAEALRGRARSVFKNDAGETFEIDARSLHLGR